MCDLHQIPPEKAIRTLKALVLFSGLRSDFKPLRIPIITTSIKTSPAEHTANEMLDIRFLCNDSKAACSEMLWAAVMNEL